MSKDVEKIEYPKEEENSLDLKEIFYLCISNWYWIVISLLICLSVGVFYILRSTPVYTRTAQIIIKEDKKGKSVSQFDEFASMGLFQSNTVLLNEIATLKSPDMMERVVKDLNLQMNYSEPGKFHRNVLYGSNLPVEVKIYNLDPEEGASFVLKLGKDSLVTLSDFKTGNREFDGKVIKGRLSQTIKTPIGNIGIYATQYYDSAKPSEIFVSRTSLMAATNKYCHELNISQEDEKSGVVNFKINDVSVERGDDIINTLIHVYNDNWVEDRNEIARSTRNFIEERLAVIVGELKGVDSDISSYKSANLVPNVEVASSMAMQNANAASNELLDLNNQLSMAKYVKSHINSTGNSFQLIPANTGFETSTLSQEVSNYNETLLERNTLLASTNEQNPLVQDMDKSLRDMRSSIQASINNIIERLNREIRTMERHEHEEISKISSNPEQAKYLLSVERQQKVKESLYLYLLQKREENELSQTFTPYNTKIIMEPTGAKSPSSPKKAQIILIALLLGMAIPIGIIILNTTLNTKVRGRKDIEQLSAPFIGEIPQYKGSQKGCGYAKRHHLRGRKKKSEAFVVVREGNRNVINEAFRVLRANIEFMAADNKVFAVTSANPDSGKTFVNYNLASSFAIKGKKTLTIDCDLRKGSLSEYVGSPQKGLTDYLVGHVDNINDIIVMSKESDNLFVIPRGTMPPNPTELLYSPRFAEMIQQLRDEYDLIFVDCPPVEIVADAAIINSEVDMTLFLVRAGLFERSMVNEIEKFYKDKKYKNMAIILNGTNAATHYGNRYGYHYGYSYKGYGGYTIDKG